MSFRQSASTQISSTLNQEQEQLQQQQKKTPYGDLGITHLLE